MTFKVLSESNAPSDMHVFRSSCQHQLSISILDFLKNLRHTCMEESTAVTNENNYC